MVQEGVDLKNLFAGIRRKGNTSQVFRDLDVSVGGINDWKNGRSVPNAVLLVRLADYFGCSMDYLLDRTEHRDIIQRADSTMKGIEEEIMIQYYNGSMSDSKTDILCHRVNCQGTFGYGIAGQVKELFPEVKKAYKRTAKQRIEKENRDTSKLLGRVSAQPVEKDGHQFLIGNLYGQDDYGKKKMVYTDYDALGKAMGEIRSFLETRSGSETVALPYKIGCGSVGGDWNVVEDIIKRTFEGYSSEVQIQKYEE